MIKNITTIFGFPIEDLENSLYTPDFIYDRGLYIDTRQRLCVFQGNEVKLRPALFNLLSFFAKNPHTYLSANNFDTTVYQVAYDTKKSNFRENISKLKKAFKPYLMNDELIKQGKIEPQIIINKPGIGYKINTALLPDVFIYIK